MMAYRRYVIRYPNRFRRQLVTLPKTYFEVDDEIPGEHKLPQYTIEIFETSTTTTSSAEVDIKTEILTIPKELNRKILQYLHGKDLLRFSMASKKAFINVEYSHRLMYDAIHQRIDDLFNESRSRRYQNEHKFRVGNCVKVNNEGSGYVVRVTPKKVFYVKEADIFHKKPVIHKIENHNVRPMRPYYMAEPLEIVKNWRTWADRTENSLNRD
jgi:hypothetical protein